MRKQALLLAVMFMSSQLPSFAFGLDSVALGAGGYAVDHNKKINRKHPVGSSVAKGAIRGAQVGTFIGVPWLGAGLGAMIGGASKLVRHRRAN